MQRWLVVYYNGNEEKVKLIDEEGGTFPFGVEPSQIADDCETINVIIEMPDDTYVPMVVIDDTEVQLEEPTQP
jgi:hypothetical protein